MPIEIKELHIKASIGNEGGQQESGASDTSGEGKQAIIAACVQQVLKILREKTER